MVNVSLNMSIITGEVASILDSDTKLLNLAMCSSMESSFFMRRFFIRFNASPGELYAEKVSLRVSLNFLNVPRSVSGFPALAFTPEAKSGSCYVT